MDIEVDAWFTVAMQRWYGNITPAVETFLQQFYDDGTPERFLNIHDPAFRSFIASLMIEVISNYDIDGIMFDHIRAGGWCVSQACNDDYAQRTGVNLDNDLAASASNPPNAAWNRLVAWNSEAVTSIVREVTEASHTTKPDLVVTAYGSPDYIWQGQDLVDWANEGILDVFYVHYRGLDDLARFNELRARLIRPSALGPNIRNADAAGTTLNGVALNQLVYEVMAYWPGVPVPIFVYDVHLTDDQINALSYGPFAIPAVPEWSLAPR